MRDARARPRRRAARGRGGSWAGAPLRETQLDLLRSLRRCALPAAAAAAAALPPSRRLDGERVLCVAAIAAIADAVECTAAADAPSPLSVLYGVHACAAVADGAEPFRFLPRDFAADTDALLCDPDLVVAPTALLDYFREIRRLVPSGNRVFDWETTVADDAAGDGVGALARLLLGARGAGQTPDGGLFLGLGDARLLDRPATSLGYAVATSAAREPDYLAGRDGALLDDLPELRDVVLVLEACTAATGRARLRVTNKCPRRGGRPRSPCTCGRAGRPSTASG